MSDAPFDRVLIPVSGEADAKATCAVARPYFAGHAGELIFVHMIETGGDGPSKTSPEALKERAGDVFAIVRDCFEGDDTPIQTELRSGPDVIDEIFAVAAEADATAIAVVPRPGNRLTKFLAGDHKHRLTESSSRPIVVLPQPDDSDREEIEDSDDGTSTDSTVVIPIDGSDASLEAVRHASVAFPGAEIRLLHVLEPRGSGVYESVTGGPSSDYEEIEDERRLEAERLFTDARDRIADLDTEVSTEIGVGDPGEAIVTHAEEVGADQIVIGRSDEIGVTKRLFGGTSETVVSRSSIPVTVVEFPSR